MTSKVNVRRMRGGIWVAFCSYENRLIPKSAGFQWDPQKRWWWTDRSEVAARVSEVQTAQVESRASDADIKIPCPEGFAYLPYQKAGIRFGLSHPNVLFGDEMGLGKTIEAIGVINADSSIRKILVICPASLKLNWKREMERWLTSAFRIGIASGKDLPLDADIVILNYDIAARHGKALRSVSWDCMICDEAHYMKNPKAQRTQAVLGKEDRGTVIVGPISARRNMFLTGTPIPNRPIEGWPLFHALAPAIFRNFFGYAKRYCGAFNNGYGWDFTGASELAELQTMLRSNILVRRLKSEVLTELPAKRRQIVEVSANGASGAVNRERKAYEASERRLSALRVKVELAKAEDDEALYKAVVAELTDAAQAAFAEISALRHATALAKVPALIEHLETAVAQGKVVCFAHHRDVVAAIVEAFKDQAVSLTGETPLPKRQEAIDRFQSDESIRLFVGNIQAAGVGITLTAASHVVFAELDWVPGNVTQAEDRCHRIGQANSVLIQHLVLDGSLDARMAYVLVEKQVIIDQALDKVPSSEPLVAFKDRAATEDASRSRLAEIAGALTAEQIEAIHEALGRLAGVCDGAVELDNRGFNKLDAYIGRSLAEAERLSSKQAALGQRIIRKYHRQLSEDLLQRAGLGNAH